MKENPTSPEEEKTRIELSKTRELLLDLFAYGVANPKEVTTLESDKKQQWQIPNVLLYDPRAKRIFYNLGDMLRSSFQLKKSPTDGGAQYNSRELNRKSYFFFNFYHKYPFLTHFGYHHSIDDPPNLNIFSPGFPQRAFEIDKLKIRPDFTFNTPENIALLNFLVSTKELHSKKIADLFYYSPYAKKFVNARKPFRDSRGFLIYPFHFDKAKALKYFEQTDFLESDRGAIYSKNSQEIYAIRKMQHDTIYVAEIAQVKSPDGKLLYIYSGMQKPPSLPEKKQTRISKLVASFFTPQTA